MYNLKTFFNIVKKEMQHILRDHRTLFILLGMPIVLVILFGFAITNEIKDAEIGFLDKSNDVFSLQLREKINASNYFNINNVLQNERNIEEGFKRGEIKMVVVVPNNFGKQLQRNEDVSIQLIADASDPNSANTVIGYMSAILREFHMKNIIERMQMPVISTQVRMLYNPHLDSTFYFVPGVITIILMLVSAMMTSITIAREKEFGNMEILLVSPLKPSIIIFGKTIPYIMLSLLNAVTILLIGYFVFQMPLSSKMWLLILEVILFIITSLSLGILISTVANNQQTALMISLMALLLPTILLSGFIFPIESMPKILQWVSHIIPAKWFIIIIKDIMLKEAGVAIVWEETLVLIGITIFFLILSIKKFSIRLS